METIDEDALIRAALQWANARLGDPSYAGLCYAFCEDAYELGGGVILDGQGSTAWEAACAYCPDLNVRASAPAGSDHAIPDRASSPPAGGTPPIGAYVFYECGGPLKGEVRNWGHVGLSLGDGRVIHAWDVVRVDGTLDIPRLAPAPGWTPAVYAGWAPPQVFLRGARRAGEAG